MDEMMEQVNSMMEAMVNNDKFFKNVAILLKKLHDELIAVGFSEDAANHICSNFKATGGN